MNFFRQISFFKKAVAVTAAAFVFICFPKVLRAYLLPDCSVSGSEMDVPAEEVLSAKKNAMSALGESVNLRRLAEYERGERRKISPAESSKLSEFRRIADEIEFWEYVVSLKASLGDILTRSLCASGANCDLCKVETDKMAKLIIDELYAISQSYRVKGSALWQNFLINSGKRDKGRCYHYVTDLRERLSKFKWNCFELSWGSAYDGKLRENNALVVTAMGAEFSSGLVIDAWRTAGRPFWREVSKDRFPWKEAPNIDYE